MSKKRTFDRLSNLFSDEADEVNEGNDCKVFVDEGAATVSKKASLDVLGERTRSSERRSRLGEFLNTYECGNDCEGYILAVGEPVLLVPGGSVGDGEGTFALMNAEELQDCFDDDENTASFVKTSGNAVSAVWFDLFDKKEREVRVRCGMLRVVPDEADLSADSGRGRKSAAVKPKREIEPNEGVIQFFDDASDNVEGWLNS